MDGNIVWFCGYCRHPTPRLCFFGPYTGTNGGDDVGHRSYHYKTLSKTDLSVTITAYMVLFMTPLSLIPALLVWAWPTWEQLAWLALVGSFGTAGHLTKNAAIRLAPTNVVMPIDFVRLLGGGYRVFYFAEILDIFVWIGGAMLFYLDC